MEITDIIKNKLSGKTEEELKSENFQYIGIQLEVKNLHCQITLLEKNHCILWQIQFQNYERLQNWIEEFKAIAQTRRGSYNWYINKIKKLKLKYEEEFGEMYEISK